MTTIAPAGPRTGGDRAEVRGYQEALRALADRGRFGVRLGLGRTLALLRELGNPQLGIRGALVAGTNGKGSVLALAGSALRAGGLRVGQTPKPHLVSYRERLVIDGRPIGLAAFTELAADAFAAADRIDRRLGPPTEFELLTAMLFRWFAEQRVDVALVEVGLGGRLDATNAWDGGVAAITNVDLDHMDRLGATVEAIAREKAAIIKRRDLAVTGATAPALGVIRRRARRMAVPLAEVTPAPVVGWDRDGIVVELPRTGATRVSLRGRHQGANVAVADALLDALEAAGIATVPPAARRSGYATTHWPGRLELLTVDGHEVVLDGAHNAAGAAALAAGLDELRPFLGAGRATLVTAMMADKDVDAIIGALLGSLVVREATILATTVGLARALSADRLAGRWRAAAPWLTVVAESEPASAVDRALGEAEGPIVVAGSLYLVGAVRALLVDDPLLVEPERLA